MESRGLQCGQRGHMKHATCKIDAIFSLCKKGAKGKDVILCEAHNRFHPSRPFVCGQWGSQIRHSGSVDQEKAIRFFTWLILYLRSLDPT